MNTVLASAVPLEFLKAVTGRDAEILQQLGGVYEAELTEHRPLQVGRKPADGLAPKQSFRIAIAETVDHRQ
jgi:hypothetical protein